MDDTPDTLTVSVPDPERRSFLARLSSALMVGGLALGYGAFAAVIGRFLYPRRPEAGRWQYVVDLASIAAGESIDYTAPAGQRVVITRLAQAGAAADFVALSSVCPHLGCQVHWESPNDRFFCPCHNGAFDARGNPIAGPPFDAGQPLPQYPLKVENGLLFIDAPTVRLT